MLCNNFECVYLDNGECEEMGGECIGDLCENWGECISCQKQSGPDDCWKDRKRYEPIGWIRAAAFRIKGQ